MNLKSKQSDTISELPDIPRTLTRAGRKLALVLCNPASAILTVAEIAKRADIHEDTYYHLMNDPRFTNYLRERWRANLNSQIANIVAAAVAVAVNPDRDGHQDRKLLLEMSGEYIPAARVDLRNLSDADLARLAGENPGGSAAGEDAPTGASER